MVQVLQTLWYTVVAWLTSLVALVAQNTDQADFPESFEPKSFDDDGSSEVPKDFEDFAGEELE